MGVPIEELKAQLDKDPNSMETKVVLAFIITAINEMEERLSIQYRESSDRLKELAQRNLEETKRVNGKIAEAQLKIHNLEDESSSFRFIRTHPRQTLLYLIAMLTTIHLVIDALQPIGLDEVVARLIF